MKEFELTLSDNLSVTVDSNTIYTFGLRHNLLEPGTVLPCFCLNGDEINPVDVSEDLSPAFVEALCILLAVLKHYVSSSD